MIGDKVQETELQVDPIVCWKLVKIRLMDAYAPSVELVGPYSFQPLSVRESVAACSPKFGVVPYQEHEGNRLCPDPGGNCNCGFNTYKNVFDALVHLSTRDYSTTGFRTIPGTLGRSASALAKVQVYGRVIEYETGYRAQKQSILSLYLNYTQHLDEIQFIRDQLAVDVEPISNLGYEPIDGIWSTWERVLEQQSRRAVCSVCLSIVPYCRIVDRDEDVRCAYHSDTMMEPVWVFSQGEDTDVEVRQAKNGATYLYQGFKLTFRRDLQEDVRAVTVFKNKRFWSVQVILQKRVKKADGTYIFPCTKRVYLVEKFGLASYTVLQRKRGKLRRVSNIYMEPRQRLLYATIMHHATRLANQTDGLLVHGPARPAPQDTGLAV